MQKIFSVSFFILILLSFNNSFAQSLTKKESKAGWQLLFDGKEIKGWHNYGKNNLGAAWKIDDGAIFLDASKKENGQIVGGGDIVSDEEYSNFHLKLEWKIGQNGNSGIILFIKEENKYKTPWMTGPEMQVLDNNGHPDSKIKKHRAGDLYDLISAVPETVRPFGEWNQVEIKSLNGKLEFWLNGKNVVTTNLWDEAWKTMIANSKFKSMPGFGTYQKGKIGLQDHGDPVWYRNIKIRRL